MWPMIGGLLSGAGSLLGGFFNSKTSAQNTQEQIQAQEQMQQESERFNAEQSSINRDYQTQMSNTAYQRASADMKAAGLNPMMMFGSGSAASSPSGATASVGTPSVPMPQKTSPWAGLGDAVSKGLSTAINVKMVDKMSEEIANLQADRLKTLAAAKTEEERPALVRAETLRTDSESARLGNLMPAFRLTGTSAKDILDSPETLRKIANWGAFYGGKFSDTISPVSDLLSSAHGVRRLLANPDNPTKKYSGLGPTGTSQVKDLIDDAFREFQR